MRQSRNCWRLSDIRQTAQTKKRANPPGRPLKLLEHRRTKKAYSFAKGSIASRPMKACPLTC